MECANCHVENESSVRFCQACGYTLESMATPALACPHCHAPNRLDAPFCRHCGQYLDVPPARFAADRRKRSALGVALLLLAVSVAAGYVVYDHQSGSQALDLAALPAASLQRLPPPVAEPAPALDGFLADRRIPPPPAAVTEPETRPAARPEAASAPETVAELDPSVRRAPPPRKTHVPNAAASSERPAPTDATQVQENPPPVAPARVTQAPMRPAAPDWYVSLKAEIRRCADASNFFSRLICTEKAKFQFCGPGKHWGEVPECVQAQTATNNY